MYKNIIELNIDDDLYCLAGEDYAKRIYEEQISNKVNLAKKNVIVIPSTIRIVSSSFVTGIVQSSNIKPDRFYKYFSIEGSDRVINKFKEILE